MTTRSNRSKINIMYIVMSGLTITWGLDYVAAKKCLDVLDVPVLLFFRYSLALCSVFVVKMFLDRKFYLHKQDIPWLILSAITGEVGYFFLEYTAMDYLPLSIITLILACVPIVSILIDKMLYNRPITSLLALGGIGSLLGVGIIIGADFHKLLQGKLTGYLLAFGAVLCWNAYNFLTARLHANYSDVSLSFFQIACTALLLAPYALRNLPEPNVMTTEVITWLIFIGFFSAGIGFVIYVRSLDILGVTPTALFSNFMPISTALLGWVFFKEMILPIQVVGGVIVIIAACTVIYEKSRLDSTVSVKATCE